MLRKKKRPILGQLVVKYIKEKKERTVPTLFYTQLSMHHRIMGARLNEMQVDG